MVPGLLIINYGVSYLAKYLEIVGVKNTLPFSLNIESQYLYGLFGLMILFLCFTKLFNKHPLSTSFIIAGALYNLIERSVYGHVFDFIKITWGYINLADLMLWFGLILLNYEVWFNTEEEYEPITYAKVVETRDIVKPKSDEVINKPSLAMPTIELATKSVVKEQKSQEPKIEEPKTVEPKINNVLGSLYTSKIRTVTDQLNKIKSSDSQEIFVPKMEQKPKKVVAPRIKVS